MVQFQLFTQQAGLVGLYVDLPSVVLSILIHFCKGNNTLVGTSLLVKSTLFLVNVIYHWKGIKNIPTRVPVTVGLPHYPQILSVELGAQIHPFLGNTLKI